RPKNSEYLNTLGVALYRVRRYNEAVRRLDEAVQAHGRGGIPEDWLFLAMAYHRLEKTAEARRWMEKAARRVDENANAEKTSGGSAPLPWGRRLQLDLFRRQAEALLPPGQP